MHCNICNSDHQKGAYDRGWILENWKIKEIRGEGKILAYARAPEGGSLIFWTEQGAKDYIEAHLRPEETQ